MQIKILLFLFLVCNFKTTNAQNKDCNCQKDLTFLDQKVRKTPAYKINKTSYEQSYTEILKKVKSANTLYDCHVLLNTLLLSLNDNHSRVYSTDTGANDEIKSNPDKLAEFKTSSLFNTYPKPNLNLDSLKSVLTSKTKKDIEGIYSLENFMTIGVFKSKRNSNYKSVVLNSESSIWSKGEILSTLIPFGKDRFLSIGGSLSSKRLIAYTERIENGLFYYMGFRQNIQQKNYSTLTLSEETYYRKEISKDITYLKIGSFNSWYPALSEAEKFYESLEDNLTKSNLILDLRNNGGGGERNSDILWKIIKRYTKNNKVYVLINHRTLSNAERFALELKQLKNTQLLGIKTNGTLAYEIKDSTYNLPCGNFVAVLTSKKKSKYLEYESHGIRPDVILDIETDWIIQVENHILKDK